jgi:hypothetical protein
MKTSSVTCQTTARFSGKRSNRSPRKFVDESPWKKMKKREFWMTERSITFQYRNRL